MMKAAKIPRHRPALGMLILLVLRPFLGTCEMQHFNAHRMKEPDLTFSIFLLWETRCTSVSCCAVDCSSDPLCSFFTVSKKASSTVQCRGHSEVPDLADGQHSEGSRSYVLGSRVRADAETPATTTELVTTTAGPSFTTGSWLSQTCQNNNDCPGDAVCLGNQNECVCPLGAFYSRTTDACQRECPADSLTDEFQVFSGMKLSCTRLTLIENIPFSECLKRCIAFTASACRSVTFNNGDSRCGLNKEPDILCNAVQSRSGFTYGQRICQ